MHAVFRLSLAQALWVTLLVAGCQREQEPKYKIPDLPPLDPAKLQVSPGGGPPAQTPEVLPVKPKEIVP